MDARRIIIAVSEDAESVQAIDWTLAHVARPLDQLFVVHTVEAGEEPNQKDTTARVLPTWSQAHELAVGTQVLRRALRRCRRHKVPAEASLLLGQPGPAICSAAEQLVADLVIVGSKGKSPFERALMGSVSDFCTHHCPCPVLVVKFKGSQMGVTARRRAAQSAAAPKPIPSARQYHVSFLESKQNEAELDTAEQPSTPQSPQEIWGLSRSSSMGGSSTRSSCGSWSDTTSAASLATEGGDHVNRDGMHTQTSVLRSSSTNQCAQASSISPSRCISPKHFHVFQEI